MFLPHDTGPPDIVEIERALSRVAQLLTRYRRHGRTVAAAGVPVDRAAVPVLRVLADAGGPVRMNEIAAELGVEAPHVTRQVQRLEQVGYVERVPDPGDRRAQRVLLREQGREAFARVRAVALGWMDEALGHWTPGDRAALAELVNRMVDDFNAHDWDDARETRA
ncbi:MarR family winged helix-turn-helix transcriptional regulator [Spirillospora sp. CA-294931]|uniref:MarR family winged helix-turn-helix transcriptional regulator n=1 Tax=Spirillospora sp. CA-294931 TaxID=3240042 RepID=UPI003D937F9D